MYSKLLKDDTRSVIDDSSANYNWYKVTNTMTRISLHLQQSLQETIIVASFLIKSKHQSFYYTIHNGSIELFFSIHTLKSGIVVASNEKCSNSKGVLGAVTRCGGEKLRENVR
jgi:hypothetical protein